MAVAIIFGLAALAFVAGTAFATFQQRDDGESTAAVEDVAGPAATTETTVDEQRAEGSASATVTVAVQDDQSAETEAEGRLRFATFDGPIVLVDAETDPELNNSVGVDLETFGGPFDGAEPTEAIVADLVVRGPAGTTVVLHPGDQPGDAIRFTVPGSGRLLVQNLLVVPDGQGRVAISTGEQAEVELTGHGRYVPGGPARAGRFVPTASARIGSLVTATDGRTLTIDLAATLGDEASHVGLAVLRLNANVGPSGGSVSIGSGEPIPWPAPAVADLAMAGTELVTFPLDDSGTIEMEYLGGSVMTVDLVGYYTNDSAPESTDGLLVLAERPVLRTIEIGTDAASLTLDMDATGVAGAAGGGFGGTVAIIEVANGETPGMVRLWSFPATEPTDPTFAVAPGQQRSTTAWLPQSAGGGHILDGPPGAVAQVWMLGVYT